MMSSSEEKPLYSSNSNSTSNTHYGGIKSSSNSDSLDTLPSEYGIGGDTYRKKKYRVDNFLPCDPRRWMHRYLMLGLMCSLSFGSYYCYDNPASLTKTIIQVMGVDNTQYNLLYSLYSWPNVILSLIGGVLIDRFIGVRIGTVVFSLLVTAGQLLFAFGGIFHSFPIMLAGRFVFGLGGENLAVAQNAYAVLWFKGRELNMVFGLLLSISRVGSTVNMNVNQKLFKFLDFIPNKKRRLGVVLLFGFGFCILSLIAGIALGLFDRRADKIVKRKKGEGEKISLRDIKDFPATLWFIFIVCVAYYVTVFPFIGVATIFVQDKYSLSSGAANIVNSLVYLISAVASPVFGIAVDRTGFNLIWLITGVVATLGCHAAFAFGSGSTYLPYLAMVGMGLAYSVLACSLWPLVAYIIPEHQLGTAYGLMQSIQNLGLAIVPIVIGTIIDKVGYLILEVFFCVCLCITLIAAIILYVLDSTRGGGKLNMSAWTRARLAKEAEEKNDESATLTTSNGIADVQAEAAIIASQNVTHNPLRPSSAFHVRNRLLSRMGAQIPDHVVHVNPLTTSMALGLHK